MNDANLIALGVEFDRISQEADRLADIYDSMREAQHRARDLGLKIIQTRAMTLEGIRVKARCWRYCEGGDPNSTADAFTNTSCAESLLADLLMPVCEGSR